MSILDQPWLADVSCGVISHVIYSLMAQAGHIAGSFVTARVNQQRQTLSKNSSLREIIQKSLTKTAAQLKDLPIGVADQLRAFLVSPEVEAILRHIFTSRHSGNVLGATIDDVKSLFRANMALQVPNAASVADNLFDALVDGCDAALQVCIDNGVLAGIDAKSAFRHRTLMGQLSGIQQTLKILQHEAPNFPQIVKYEDQYRSQVSERHAYLTPPHLDRSKKVPIDDLYVAPSIQVRSRTKTSRGSVRATPEGTLSILDFLLQMHRSVLLGTPGAGKTTLSSKLAHDLCLRVMPDGRRLTPIVVVLRDYAVLKREKHCSIVDFIDVHSRSSLQLPQSPSGTFEYLLRSGRSLVIFDGLDELLHTADRREIAEHIESFGQLYPTVPILVTSREVGYQQAPLNAAVFKVHYLAEFDERQVAEYARKWFATDEELDGNEQKRMADAFISESSTVQDLRSNALMLALMCQLYRGENYVPANRPDVYKKCALMLFDRWDKNRKILTGYSFEEQLSQILPYLAHWIYSDQKLQTGVSEQQLIDQAAQYWYQRRYKKYEHAEIAARDFIRFCHGRAWVFTDTGSNEQTSTYQFTHRTFLEYFTAAYLFRTNPVPEKLLAVLIPRVKAREWDVVAQLAFHIESRETEGAGDSLMCSLVDTANKDKDSRVAVANFASRCLEFIQCSPNTVKKVTELAYSLFFELAYSSRKTQDCALGKADREDSEHLLGNIVCVSDENRDSVADTLKEIINFQLESEDILTQAVAASIALELAFSSSVRRHPQATGKREERSQYWREVRKQIVLPFKDKIVDLCREYEFLATSAKNLSLIEFRDLIRWHGVAMIFDRLDSSPIASSTRPYAQPWLWQMFACPFSSAIRKRLEVQEGEHPEIALALLDTPLPWSDSPGYGSSTANWSLAYIEQGMGEKPVKVDVKPDSLFVCFCLLATLFETLEPDVQNKVIRNLEENPLAPASKLIPLLKTWIEGNTPDDTARFLDNLGLTGTQHAFVSSWAAKKLVLTGTRA